jgi:RNA polymerase primary sigma factor
MRQLTIQKSITNRESTSVEKYLQDISKYPLISIEEEVELVQRIKAGDTTGINKLVQANLRFVVSVSKQYQNQGLTLPDLINEGNLGLIKAATKFDETRGFKFISYAVWWIRQTINEAIYEQGRMVRLPLNQLGTISKTNKFIQNFEQKNDRPPHIFEISDMLDIPVDKLRLNQLMQPKHISFDIPVGGNDDGQSLFDIIENPDAPAADAPMIKESLSIEIENALNGLDSRLKFIVIHSFGIGTPEKTLEDIGKMLSINRERVRQLLNIAKTRLKKKSRLKSYLN